MRAEPLARKQADKSAKLPADKSDQERDSRRRRSHIIWWVPPLTVALISVFAAVVGRPADMWCRYERRFVVAGEWWRLVSASFIHLGWSHMLLNFAALTLIAFLFRFTFPARIWWTAILGCSLGTCMGLLALNPDIEWYVGLSGMLHGILALGLMASAGEYRWLAAIGGGCLVAKLLAEQLAGPIPITAQLTGPAVVPASHLYGAVSGAIIGSFRYLWIRFSIERSIAER